MSILDRFIGDTNERALKDIQPLVDEINKLESGFKDFSDEQLKEKSEELKKKADNLDAILP